MKKIGLFRVTVREWTGFEVTKTEKPKLFITLQSAIKYVERISGSKCYTKGIETALCFQQEWHVDGVWWSSKTATIVQLRVI